MSMRTITRAVRGGACAVVTGALVVGVGVGFAPAQAATSADTTTVRLKVGASAPVKVRTTGARAAELLSETGVRVDGNDKVRVFRDGHRVRKGARRLLRDGDLVKVTVVSRVTRTREVEVEHGTRIKRVTSLAPGKRKVARKGRDGLREVTVKLKQHNGRTVARRVDKRTLVKPKPKVVLVGKPKIRSVPGADGLNWGGLARCESGGNPRAVNPAGYYGLYQFNVGTWRSVGGSGMPHHASPAEQTYRAKKLYASRGRSPWPHCGRYL